MKRIVIISICMLVQLGCKNVNRSGSETEHDHNIEAQTGSPKKVLSPHTSAMSMIGDAHIHIDYSSPGVRNRIIFGGLLAYDEVWQAGAHMATWIESNKDLVIEGKVLEAGKYGFFAIPSREEWVLIFNRRWDQHGKDEYNPEEDVLRISVKSEISEQITENLTYRVEKTGDQGGIISLSWEKITVQFPFQIK